MGNRLSKIYTRTGDAGTTGLGDGERVSKDSVRVEAYGTVDELNSLIGLLLASKNLDALMRDALTEIQHDLFDLGGELCIPGFVLIKPEFTQRLENTLDEFNQDLPALKDFILPGGGEAAARCHVARTVCRRAERRIWTLINLETSLAENNERVNPEGAKYLNRLSDLLFVMARVLARQESGSEVLWKRGKQPKDS
ncbi:MAG: cob(I)yrinic acid a,c-diamide adenosyltransferase [Gammaproteobacteria bacterium]|nr:cob(I)yrinic acid a,c-diamide adenosyltransferase [Gammaproteobacteria bacterium]NNC97148.1 cob(I)yrinic acid a,c-diamide adenosyltransferase [Gammaproteobacteria bacterium]NNM13722.1 cob(I)yrinic acid a,c-diamide adenosyltransferase [Gammaproteobacteria bacterium]